ncbi:MAG: hypothetical protein KKF68_00895 [Nanoarchaeota archaeon]|nr:hypothetical protein [Nanoarchaeota archaeon]
MNRSPIDRRTSLKKIILFGAIFLVNPGKTFSETIPLSPSNGNFTLEQIRQIYKREYNEGLHLNNYVTPDCIATYQRGKGKIPERAIKITLNHLEEMMIKEWLKYPGWPDSFHGHFFLPEKSRSEIIHLKGIELLQASLSREELGVIYHNAEKLAKRNPPVTGAIDSEAKRLISVRSVIGWYDGRPLELAHPLPDDPIGYVRANTAQPPKGFSSMCPITFKAHKNGVFSISPFGEKIRIDFSFDDFDYEITGKSEEQKGIGDF